MAKNWAEAQDNEVKFWKSIYVEKRHDVPSYMTITDDTALAFSKKSVERFGHTLSSIYGKVIVDVGCGPYGLIKGFQVNAQRTENRPKKIYGVDPLMDSYLTFGTLPAEPYIEYISAKAESMPIEDGSCNYVYCTNVIDHVEYPDKVLAECRRICEKTGEVCFAVHIVKFPFSLLRAVLFLVDKNHPHHFSKRYVMSMARKHFRSVTLSRMADVMEDHPEFTLFNVFRSPDKLRGLKRWMSTFLISMCYLKCSN